MNEIALALSLISFGLERIIPNYPVIITGILFVVTGVLMLLGK